ncbi:type II toxin-antitoxin system ParD family antitoxin [Cryomorpha ignava]|uniref:Type II toxin-antitoxin system ParD family antitoxin n=1 Tax=Cryomorpha ignava TaxID=101383 RepID=A0A7K3WR00_9FLAO|nr:type II toxin-antitoxin system ParD family antitoxin [Cryomorpha ignava]NEN23272.1 type II toxin-antitoxin system ParD family antitoxin [Cryomorpha ignava]
MNISFTKKQVEYITSQVESGDYQNNSEVIREALRLHQIYRDKLIADLQTEIEKGLNSGNSQRSVKDIIESKRKSRKTA